MSAPAKSRFQSIILTFLSGVWAPSLLAVVTFLVYLPSLQSDFVYDARHEILEEGFITSTSNLPDVLTFKVLGMNLILGDRPGQLLYMMLIAAVCGRQPFGYHLGSDLLHAANVALLFIFVRRLIVRKYIGVTESNVLKALLAAGTAVLIFALHPIAVESVSEVSYSSSLLVALFTLLALLAATDFDPKNFRSAILAGSLGTLCVFAAITSKESGLTALLMLGVYWFLFRRREAKAPWFLFLSAATIVTAVFLVVRFHMAPPSRVYFPYLGGSFGQLLLIQPRLWVFMMGQLLWPLHLSADYTPENGAGISVFHSYTVLIAVVLAQGWLAYRSRMGALGVAFYWLGLTTVSNFIPLYHALADRYYYLPLAGIALQLLALLLMVLEWLRTYLAAMAALLVALLPLGLLTLARQKVFADEYSLWTDTLKVSPRSSIAHNSLGAVYYQRGDLDEAKAHFQKALEISPGYAEAYNNLGLVFYTLGQWDPAMANYKKSIEMDPNQALAHNNLGLVLIQEGKEDEGVAEIQIAIEIRPNYTDARRNLIYYYMKKGDYHDAIKQLNEVLRLDPDDIEAQGSLAKAQVLSGEVPEPK